MSQKSNLFLNLPDVIFEILFEYMMSHERIFIMTQNRRFLSLLSSRKLCYAEVTTMTPELFKRLLELKFNGYDTELIMAYSISNNNLELVKHLVGQEQFEIPNNKEIPQSAIYENDYDYQYELHNNDDLDNQNMRIINGILIACHYGYTEMIKWLLEVTKETVTIQNLEAAINSGNFALVKWLVEDFKIEFGECVLNCAANKGDIVMFEYLLSKNTDDSLNFDYFIESIYKSKKLELLKFYVNKYPLTNNKYKCQDIVVHGTLEMLIWARDDQHWSWGKLIWNYVTKFGSRDIIEWIFTREDIDYFDVTCEIYLLQRGFVDLFCTAIERLQYTPQNWNQTIIRYEKLAIYAGENRILLKRKIPSIVARYTQLNIDDKFGTMHLDKYTNNIKQYINQKTIQLAVFGTILSGYMIFSRDNTILYKNIIDRMVDLCDIIYCEYVCDFYIMINEYDMIEKVLIKKAPITSISLARAVFIGNQDILNLLRKYKCPMDELSYCYAACNLQKIKWLYQEGCLFDQRAYILCPNQYEVDGKYIIRIMLQTDVLECYIWLLQCGCPLNGQYNEQILSSVIFWGFIDVLDLLFKNGFTFDMKLLRKLESKIKKKGLNDWFIDHNFILQ